MTKQLPLVLIACSAAALLALLALPWVSSDLGTITLVQLIKAKGNGWQVGLFILAPLVLAIAVGAASLKTSRRWMTGVLAFTLLIPAGLSAVAKHAASGAHIAALASAVALICAITMTVKPVRASLGVVS